MYYQVNKPTHGSQEWLKIRWKTDDGLARISASVASVVHGENPYTTPADLAIELMADEPPTPKETTPDMERGNRLEPVLIEWWASMNGEDVGTPEVMFCYDVDGVRLIATLDGILEDGTPVEVKTTRKRWNGQLPPNWYWQGVQQAICANSDKIEWIIFDQELTLHHHVQKVTSDEKGTHIAACRAFLQAIDSGMLPEIAEVDIKVAAAIHPESNGATVELPTDIASDLITRLDRVRTLKKQAEAEEARLKGEVGLLLGNAEVGTLAGQVAVTWRSISRDSFDMTSFEKAHPALVKQYRKKQSYRIMKIHNER